MMRIDSRHLTFQMMKSDVMHHDSMPKCCTLLLRCNDSCGGACPSSEGWRAKLSSSSYTVCLQFSTHLSPACSLVVRGSQTEMKVCLCVLEEGRGRGSTRSRALHP
jgi:hypothetical protein